MNQPSEMDEGQVDLVQEPGTDEKSPRWAWKKADGTCVPLRGDVRFEEVDFGYDSRHPILKKISLYAKSGQKIAFGRLDWSR